MTSHEICVTDDQITALRQEAARAGDAAMVAICSAALGGDEDARLECALVINAAQDMI